MASGYDALSTTQSFRLRGAMRRQGALLLRRSGWGRLVREGKYERHEFDDQLVDASAKLIRERWQPEPFPEWITAIPSRRHPGLVYDFASRLARSSEFRSWLHWSHIGCARTETDG